MNIVISGYGNMGREIEKLARASGHDIVAVFNHKSDWDKNHKLLRRADVAIDFSEPDAVVSNIKTCFSNSLAIVVGTTAWDDFLLQIKKQCLNENQSLIYAPNFSIGVNILFSLNQYLAKIMNTHENYNAWINEIHHINKKDAPSGTAIKLGEGILKYMDRYNKWEHGQTNSIPKSSLAIDSIRKGQVKGIHEVHYQSYADEITLTHKAFNRTGFAKGALLAAEFISSHRGFFEFKDILNIDI